MTESELYKNLGSLTKSKDQWEENIAETDIRKVACLRIPFAEGKATATAPTSTTSRQMASRCWGEKETSVRNKVLKPDVEKFIPKYLVANFLFADYPSTTSITIIKTKPMAKPIVERLVWAPWAVSGMSSSTTTYIMAPAAKANR